MQRTNAWLKSHLWLRTSKTLFILLKKMESQTDCEIEQSRIFSTISNCKQTWLFRNIRKKKQEPKECKRGRGEERERESKRARERDEQTKGLKNSAEANDDAWRWLTPDNSPADALTADSGALCSHLRQRQRQCQPISLTARSPG